MSEAIVIDASVALKWLLPEEHAELAQALLEESLRARRPILGPPHLPSEVTNAVYQRLRRRNDGLTLDQAQRALTQFLRLPIQFLTPPDLYQQAFAFARTHQLKSIYDSLYVVLAQMVEAELWTDDQALLRSLGAEASWVRWIGDYQAS